MSKLEGRKVYITDKESIYYDEWGIIKLVIGGYYHIAIANGSTHAAFTRDQFRIPREAGRTIGDVERIKEVSKMVKALYKDGIITADEKDVILDTLFRA